MENQHQKITGYRDLSEDEISMINTIKNQGPLLEEIIRMLNLIDDTDKRWVAIGKTHLQEGLSALVRSVAKPESF